MPKLDFLYLSQILQENYPETERLELEQFDLYENQIDEIEPELFYYIPKPQVLRLEI